MKYYIDKDTVVDVTREDGVEKCVVLFAGSVIEFNAVTEFSDKALNSEITVIYGEERRTNTFQSLLGLGWRREHLLAMGYKEDES